MVDRFLAQFPISDNTGYSATEVVAAVQNGEPVTFERKRLGDYAITHGPFVWSSERVALSVAMASAGWGHLDKRTQRIAEADTEIRRVRIERGIDQGQVTS